MQSQNNGQIVQRYKQVLRTWSILITIKKKITVSTENLTEASRFFKAV